METILKKFQKPFYKHYTTDGLGWYNMNYHLYHKHGHASFQESLFSR